MTAVLANSLQGVDRQVTALVVEDSKEYRYFLTTLLKKEGFSVEAVEDGQRAIEYAQVHSPEIILLDLSLPTIDGLEVCRRVRTFSDAYIIMLTARAEEVDKLTGLSIGADDYITKPFSHRELIARIRVLLRRSHSQPESETVKVFGDLEINVPASKVKVAGKVVELTQTEFAILNVLSSRPEEVVTRQRLIDQVWGPDWFSDEHVIHAHISNLRRKLESGGSSEHRYISTVRGKGYRFDPSSEDS